MYVIFWGHGDWGPEDGYTFIPQGSQLYFFARHKEEINTERMDSILYAVKEGIDRRGTVRIGRVPATPAWAMRREMLSQRFTTCWEEVIGVRG